MTKMLQGMARSSMPSWIPAGISTIIATGKAVFTPDPEILHISAYFDAGSFVLCQHSMDNVVAAALRGNSLYLEEIVFSRF